MTNGNLEIHALSALGDATRRMIFEKIAARPSTVGELARGMTVSRSAVSQHLRVLKLAQLVVDQPEGARRIYRLDQRGILLLRAWLDSALP
jgi:DNA-binding transcriptional ArsR family regulator